MSENKKLVPKRRFKEFQNADAWEQRELGEVVFVNSGRDYKHLSVGNIPVYGTGGYMLSVNNKLSDEDAVGIGRKGSIDNPQYLRAPFWTVDTLFFLTPKEEMNLRFFYAMAQGIKWRQFDESTGVPSLSKVNIEKITKNFPKIEEQKIIGQFFQNLDQTIAFQQRKLEKMKSMKSAYLSEMFPAAGERKPKRRFPGFTDDWEQRELGELFKFQYGEGNTIPNDGGFYPVYGAGGQQGYYSKYNAENSIIIGHVGDAGAVSWAEGKHFVTYNGTITTSKLDDFPIRFGYYLLLNSDLRKLTGGSSLKFLTYEMISSIYTQIPKSEIERIEIANLFHQLDQTIAFQQQKLEKLQNIKKAYLNEMFI